LYDLATMEETDKPDWRKHLEQRDYKTLTLHIHSWLDICDNCAASLAQLIACGQLTQWLGLKKTAKFSVIVSSAESWVNRINHRSRMLRGILSPVPSTQPPGNDKIKVWFVSTIVPYELIRNPELTVGHPTPTPTPAEQRDRPPQEDPKKKGKEKVRD